jgi:hypothetical protein
MTQESSSWSELGDRLEQDFLESERTYAVGSMTLALSRREARDELHSFVNLAIYELYEIVPAERRIEVIEQLIETFEAEKAKLIVESAQV